mmetsp:Transcript_6208/g.15409  ORF Transcript_6208/g.15409 Transcript_6208/m.15409 type:complete len:252 (+) Transcript_6208:219-974(+)
MVPSASVSPSLFSMRALIPNTSRRSAMAPLRSPTPRLDALWPRTARRCCTWSPTIRLSMSAFLNSTADAMYASLVSSLSSTRPSLSACFSSTMESDSKSTAVPVPAAEALCCTGSSMESARGVASPNPGGAPILERSTSEPPSGYTVMAPGLRICWRRVTLMERSFSFSSAISALRALLLRPAPIAPTSATVSVIPTKSMPNGVTHSVLPSSTCWRAFCSSVSRRRLKNLMDSASRSARSAMSLASSTRTS